MTQLLERILAWVNTRWNKRKTSAKERNLAKTVKQQQLQIEQLAEDKAKLLHSHEMQLRSRDDSVEQLQILLKERESNLSLRELEIKNFTEAYQVLMQQRRDEIKLIVERNGHADA